MDCTLGTSSLRLSYDVGGLHWLFLEVLERLCVERSWCSSVEACRDGRGGRIAVWWSSSWATMLCCSFRVYQPSGMDGGFYITLQFCSVLREGVYAILTLIDMEDFEMTMEGTYIPVLVRQRGQT